MGVGVRGRVKVRGRMRVSGRLRRTAKHAPDSRTDNSDKAIYTRRLHLVTVVFLIIAPLLAIVIPRSCPFRPWSSLSYPGIHS